LPKGTDEKIGVFSSLIRSFLKSVVVFYTANRLIETQLSPTTLQPIYNGLGDRAGQTVNSTTTDYALDVAGGLPEVIYTSDDDRYLHLPGLIVAESAAGEVRYLMPDGLGSIRQAVDSQGEVAVYHEFDPYGSPIETGSLVATPFYYPVAGTPMPVILPVTGQPSAISGQPTEKPTANSR
jgi:hypothetical protein